MPRSVNPSRFSRTRSPSVWRLFALLWLLAGIVASCWGRSSPDDFGPLSLAAQSVDDLGEDWPADRCATIRLLESPAWLATGSLKFRIGDEPITLRYCGGRHLRLTGQLLTTPARVRSVGSLWATLQTRDVRLQV